jgi:hypothetical protein
MPRRPDTNVTGEEGFSNLAQGVGFVVVILLVAAFTVALIRNPIPLPKKEPSICLVMKGFG